jgi:5'-methylthioadenosine phosphorylase
VRSIVPIHIKARREDIAANVIASGDPARVDLIAGLLSDVKVVNTHRGLKVVTGYYKNTRITLATHGIGAPSAAIVFEELNQLGAKRIVRLGTTGGIRKDTRVGDIIVVTAAAYTQGGCAVGQYMPGICGATGPDPKLTYYIMRGLEERGIPHKYGPVFSSDSFYSESEEFVETMSKYGIIAVEMEAAALFALGWMRGFETACVLVVSDVLHGEGDKGVFLTTEELASVFLKVGEVILDVYDRYYRAD